MGQQQLLLLVLGIVIVGIAVVAGIQAFSEGKDKADRDAMVTDAMRVISDIQAWKLKPAAFGGGAEAIGFSGVNLNQLALPDSSGHYYTSGACIELDGANDKATLTIKHRNGGNCSTPGATVATVDIEGTRQNDIKWDWEPGS
jgi:hypothetical protein